MFKIQRSVLSLFLSRFYGAGLCLRAGLYNFGVLKRRRGALPSVCVGNVVLGGSAKTPFTQYLACELKERGYQVAVLLRGYGGSIKEATVVRSTHSSAAVGDEALLHRQRLAKDIPVVISANRLAGIEKIKKETEARIVVLDDGLQHLALKPDFSILMLNSSSPEVCRKWQLGTLLPAGYLREPLAAALSRCDFVVHSYRCDQSETAIVATPDSSIPSAHFSLRAGSLYDILSGEQVRPADLAGASLRAATAIAEPELFFSTLKQAGFNLQETKSYEDHYHFRAADISTLLRDEVRLLITEKDAVKILPLLNASGIGVGRVFALSTEAAFMDESSESLFWDTFEKHMSADGR